MSEHDCERRLQIRNARWIDAQTVVRHGTLHVGKTCCDLKNIAHGENELLHVRCIYLVELRYSNDTMKRFAAAFAPCACDFHTALGEEM